MKRRTARRQRTVLACLRENRLRRLQPAPQEGRAHGIANYTDLKGGVARWRTCTDIDTQIPTFITLAESRIALTVAPGRC